MVLGEGGVSDERGSPVCGFGCGGRTDVWSFCRVDMREFVVPGLSETSV